MDNVLSLFHILHFNEILVDIRANCDFLCHNSLEILHSDRFCFR
jgi:hypothetical protein